ncbi:hypothetical protein PISMIDRAFT_579010 [Pisolithus microcarpus 441]|uniref:Unplaced genomic scaffold scaffold_79, whole genome shotgun sequence n=1 Tax=Pisolithus microcarpus 441 TaxID=765257 RepID=A0A0C9ZKW4_9AGAM|nr:hypothetical protein PISMIDRAFT_579010 [Pisolithus microcarpus 441]
MTMDSVSTMSPHIAPHRPHTLPPTAPLSSQVGGHAGIQTTAKDDSLLLKPALPGELEFYQLIRDGMSRDIDATTVTGSESKPLLPWIPIFLGVLSLGNHLVENLLEMTAAHCLPALVQADGTTTTICKAAQLQHAHHTVFELFLNCRVLGKQRVVIMSP